MVRSGPKGRRQGPNLTKPDIARDQRTSARQKSVFISHASADHDWVEAVIVDFLRAHKFRPWYSEHAIATAAQWEREILQGMSSCAWFVLIVSEAASKSDWVKDEGFWAMEHRRTKIVPIILERCDLYKFHIRLPRIQYVDFTRNQTTGRRKLLGMLGSDADGQGLGH
jgi:hypothetical protein